MNRDLREEGIYVYVPLEEFDGFNTIGITLPSMKMENSVVLPPLIVPISLFGGFSIIKEPLRILSKSYKTYILNLRRSLYVFEAYRCNG